MKYVANLLWAFLLTFLMWTLVREWLGPASQDDSRYLIYGIPFSVQILFWWALFSFPRGAAQIGSLIGSGILGAISYGASGIGNLIEQMWKYRAGQIVLGGGAAYVIYHLFF